MPKCDRCGRFTTNDWKYDDYQPDPWNGPRVTRLCDRCDARPEGSGVQRDGAASDRPAGAAIEDPDSPSSPAGRPLLEVTD